MQCLRPTAPQALPPIVLAVSNHWEQLPRQGEAEHAGRVASQGRDGVACEPSTTKPLRPEKERLAQDEVEY
jgi:hypothetical protein